MSKISALVLTSFLTTACITQSMASGLFEEQERTQSYNLGSTEPNPFEFQHFSIPEGQHIWTAATECSLSMPVIDDAARLKHVQFTVHAFANETHPQSVQVFLNDNEVISEREFKNMAANALDIDIPADLIGNAKFRFVIPEACKPAVIDSSNLDGRILGFSFTNATLTYSETVEIEDTEDEVTKKDIMKAAALIALSETQKALVSAGEKIEKEVPKTVESASRKIEKEAPKTVASVERSVSHGTEKAGKELKKTAKSIGKKVRL